LIDLHVHSNASDGSDSPTEVVRKAAAIGLSALALTDHDTVSGIPEAMQQASASGVELIPGIELSVGWKRGAMHLIVLFLRPGDGPLQQRLADLRTGRTARNVRIIECLEEIGLPVTQEEVLEFAVGESVGRPHIAAVMLRKGYVESIAAAFDQYLGLGKPAYVARPRLEPTEAIRLASAEGAVTVLAHPHTLGLDSSAEVASTLSALAEAGLVGMECHCPPYSPLEREAYEALARRFGLLPSGGSDYHGTFKPETELGIGRGNLFVPDHFLDALRPR
jgi:predicted metal-dependent phosphoesterase TrpH